MCYCDGMWLRVGFDQCDLKRENLLKRQICNLFYEFRPFSWLLVREGLGFG